MSEKRSSEGEDSGAKRARIEEIKLPSAVSTPGALSSRAATPVATPQPATPTPSQLPASNATTANTAKSQTNSDPEKLSDAIAAAGVDLKDEENRMSSTLQHQRRTNVSTLLHPAHLTTFMNKVLAQHGVRQQGLENDTELLQLVSAACETFVSSIVTDSIVLSRHRRRPIKSKRAQGTTPRSDVSKALRDIATKQKEMEEKRAQRRIALGVDTSGEEVKKVGAEETLHRAANATAAMMTGSKKKKKYSWMSAETDSPKSSSVLARGDNGIRYREAREEKEVVLRDLLAAMESRRMGVDKALVKGYAKLKD